MGGKCKTFDHHADVGLDACADTLAELIEVLGAAAAGIIVSPGSVRAGHKRRLHVEGDNPEDLAVDFLNEIIGLIQGEHFAVKEVNVTQAGNDGVKAEVAGEPLDTERHDILTEVKAATYHELEVSQSPDGKWSARIILDI